MELKRAAIHVHVYIYIYLGLWKEHSVSLHQVCPVKGCSAQLEILLIKRDLVFLPIMWFIFYFCKLKVRTCTPCTNHKVLFYIFVLSTLLLWNTWCKNNKIFNYKIKVQVHFTCGSNPIYCNILKCNTQYVVWDYEHKLYHSTVCYMYNVHTRFFHSSLLLIKHQWRRS